jgi:nitroreductase
MNVKESILERRSIRRFTDRPVSLEDLKTLMEAGRWAPTGGNRQPWEFITVQNPQMIRNIKMFSEGLSGDPSLIIALCTPDRGQVTMIDLGMAAENIMLQCVELGMGSCAIASFNLDAVKRLLGIPENIELPLLLSIGYPDGKPRIRPKKELQEIWFMEKYGVKKNE